MHEGDMRAHPGNSKMKVKNHNFTPLCCFPPGDYYTQVFALYTAKYTQMHTTVYATRKWTSDQTALFEYTCTVTTLSMTKGV